MNIEINNKTKYKISKKKLGDDTAGAIDYLVKQKIITVENFFLSIALIGAGEIKKINSQYRNKQESTDVLSFCYDKNKEELSGEIILCPEVIEKNAKIDGVSFAKELYKNIIHGILHIVGFEHNKKMFAIQEGILSRIK